MISHYEHDSSTITLTMHFSGMLDHIMVESNGAKVPLSRVAVVSVLDPKSLSVTPYDPNVSLPLLK